MTKQREWWNWLAAAGMAFCATACASPQGREGFGGPRPRGEPASGFNQTRTSPVGLMFAGMDANADRRVSRSELTSSIGSAWTAADTDLSGDLRATEQEIWAKEWLGRAAAYPDRLRFDRNLDGKIGRGEFEQTLIQVFEAADADRDGALTRAELVEDDTPPRRRAPEPSPLDPDQPETRPSRPPE